MEITEKLSTQTSIEISVETLEDIHVKISRNSLWSPSFETSGTSRNSLWRYPEEISVVEASLETSMEISG